MCSYSVDIGMARFISRGSIWTKSSLTFSQREAIRWRGVVTSTLNLAAISLSPSSPGFTFESGVTTLSTTVWQIRDVYLLMAKQLRLAGVRGCYPSACTHNQALPLRRTCTSLRWRGPGGGCASRSWGTKGRSLRRWCLERGPAVADAQANSRPAKKRRDRWRWRDGTGPANFCLPGGQEHGAQRSVPVLWKRSFCSSGPDRNGTVSCRGHRRPTLQPPPSLGPTRSALAASPASTPALASASPSAFVLPAPDIPGNTSKPKGRPRRYQSGPSWPWWRVPEMVGIPWTPVWQGVGIMAVELARGIGMWTRAATKIARHDQQPETTPQPG